MRTEETHREVSAQKTLKMLFHKSLQVILYSPSIEVRRKDAAVPALTRNQSDILTMLTDSGAHVLIWKQQPVNPHCNSLTDIRVD